MMRQRSDARIKGLACHALAGFLLFATGGCLKGDGKFGDLASGTVEDIDELVIDQALPDLTSVIIEQGQSQSFFVSARAPAGRVIGYAWTLNGTSTASGASHTLTASAGNIGNHTLGVVVTDGVVTKQKSWNVKVNGAPVLTPATAGTPKVSVGSSVPITINAADPNNDSLTYAWKLNGVSSPYLSGTGPTATLTGDASIVGAMNIQVTVSDGSASETHTWTAEVNHFPQACNQLTTGQICTVAGSPSLGDNTDPLNSDYDLKITPIAHVQDSLGNFFIADWGNNVVWYWNKTNAAVTRLSVTIPANRIKVVAGTGEAASGADGIALDSGINGPRGLYYHDATQRLYISEWNSGRVRYVDNNGFIYTGIGGGSSHTNGATAFTHACSNPAGLAYNPTSDSLYIACRGHHRVKRWDFGTDSAYTVLGNGSSGWGTLPAAPTSVALQAPYGLHYVDGQGLYVAHMDVHRVSFLNMSGSAKTFWSASTPVTVPDGQVNKIVGTGVQAADTGLAPGANRIDEPSAVAVDGNIIYVLIRGSNSDTLYAANNSASPQVIGGTSVGAGLMQKISSATAGYNGTGVSLASGQMNDPYAMTLDVSDPRILHISDYNNRRLRYASLSDAKLYNRIGSGKSRYGLYSDVARPTLEHLFQYITGLAFDSVSRELFFTDSQNCRVRRLNPYGVVETAVARSCANPVVENDVPSNSSLQSSLSYDDNDLNGLTLLPDRSMVIANTKANNMRIWNRTAADSTYYSAYVQNDRISNLVGDYLNQGNSDGAALSARLYRPSDSVYDSVTDSLLFVDSRNNCIRSLSKAGNVTEWLGSCGTTGNSGTDILPASLQLNRPTAIALDSSGNVIFTDRLNHKVRYYNRGTSPVTIGSITINPGRIAIIACTNGTSGSNTENIVATSAACNRPTGLAVSSNYICFSNQGSHNVRCIGASGSGAGRINTVAGYPQASARAGSPYGFEQEGVPGTSATLYYPSALAFGGNGDLYISDTYNHIVRKLKLAP